MPAPPSRAPGASGGCEILSTTQNKFQLHMYDSISKAEVTGDPGRGGPRSKVDQGGPPALTHVVVDCHMTQDWQAMCDMVPGAGEREGGRHACGGQAHTHTHTDGWKHPGPYQAKQNWSVAWLAYEGRCICKEGVYGFILKCYVEVLGNTEKGEVR